MASCIGESSVITSLSTSRCTICHFKIVSEEFVMLPDGRPYHTLCLSQRNICQTLPEDGCSGEQVEEGDIDKENASRHFPEVECPSQQVKTGLEYNTSTPTFKQEHRILAAIMDFIKKRYSGITASRQSVKIFAMTDDDFIL